MRYTVAIVVHVTVDANNEKDAEQKAFESPSKYLNQGRTITHVYCVRKADTRG